jgi:PIN domain nuclease of toxin-antitoxin system
VRLLLDTHVALWAVAGSPRLRDAARHLIEDPGNEIWVSAASLWEIAIKHALGRDRMPVSGREAASFFTESGYRLLPVDPEHAIGVADLPPLHTDPFDRLLLSQSLLEPMRLLTSDTKVQAYGGNVIAT